MISARLHAMNYPKIMRFLLPLAIIFLFIYLSATKLPDVRAYECVEDGKPCEEVPVAARAGSHVTESPPLQVEAELEERSCGENDFRIGRMLRSFRSCVTRDDQVLLEEYLDGWRELIKFMDSLGTVFTFISSETRTKINILQGYLDGEHGQSYRTISSMIRYELDNQVVNFRELPRNRVPSGCRTLLRMHRALKWLEDFLYKLGTSPGQERTSELCAESYHKTLAHHHSWFIRQVAEVAFLALPPLEKMYEVVCVKDQAEARVVLLTTVDAIAKVYNITQELYTDNKMLDLP